MAESRIPWEDGELSPLKRVTRTLALPLKPQAGAQLMVDGRLSPALTFALVTLLPLAFLRGIIPWTHHIWFAPALGLKVDSALPWQVLAFDIGRAGSFGVVMTVALWLALALPFVHLLRAFSRKRHAGAIAWRTLFYGAWLVPLSLEGVLHFGLFWVWPQPAHPFFPWMLLVLDVLPLLLLLTLMRIVARSVCGVSLVQMVALLLVPLLSLFLMRAWCLMLLQGALPVPPESRDVPEDTSGIFAFQVQTR